MSSLRQKRTIRVTPEARCATVNFRLADNPGIKGCLLVIFSWLMPRDYGRLSFLQDGNSEGFFTASFQVSDYD
jgi:hypothetical protein